MYNPFWEQQQKLFQNFTKNMGMPFPNMFGAENTMPNMGDFYKKWMESMTGAQTMPANPWADFYKTWSSGMANMPGIPGMGAFKMPGMEIYGQLYDFWKGMSNPTEFMANYQEKYSDLMQQYYKSILPEGSMQYFQKPKELMDTCVSFYQNIMSPWMKIDEDILKRISSGDKQAYIEFFKQANAKYEESFGKMFNMMGMGINREQYADEMQAMSAYYKMLLAAGELSALLYNTGTDTMKDVVAKYQQIIQKGEAITSFKEFYKLWYQVNEDALLSLFNTEAFSIAFGNFSDKYAQYMIATNKVIERKLAPLPIPTKTDMDSLYLTVHNLRKEVRQLQKEIEALKNK